MDDLAVTPEPATTHRTGVSFSSIGVEVEEAVFLDEADGHGAGAGESDHPSPFDLFADEEDLRPAASSLLAAPTPYAAAPAEQRPAAAASPDGPTPARAATRGHEPARVKPAVKEPGLVNTLSASRRGTISLIGLFVLVATTTMFLTVQACDVKPDPQSATQAQPFR